METAIDFESKPLINCPDLYKEYFSKNKNMTFEERAAYSALMRRQYMEEVAALKAKLKILRNRCRNELSTEGKRLRQRSESEPGYSTNTAASSSSFNKRARDNSPVSKTYRYHRQLPAQPAQSLTSDGHKYSFRTNRTESPYECSAFSTISSKESNDLFETDDEESICLDDGTSITGVSDCEDEGAKSATTSQSSDSNASSQVGDVLSSISLIEKVPPKDSQSLVDESFFRASLFSNVPPYIRFFMHDTKGPPIPAEISKHLKWRLSSITPIIVRRTLINSGFKLVRKSNEWTGQWGKHMNSIFFKTLKDFQKLNHFPGTFQIGRKDRLWKNLHRLILKFGKREFWFVPKTYILPQENKALRHAWEKSGGKERWIIKPPAAARGAGIRVINRWAQVPKNQPVIVQKYISRPYLINGSKFDLRLYVLMTSIHPLRIYLYNDGLVRFASVKYSEDTGSLDDRYMHLTNYSINKLSNQYRANEDASSCQGHKWTLLSLWAYLENCGVDVKSLRESLTELVIKTIISGESFITQLSKTNLPSRYNSYELFGIDVLLDANLRPWLLEVNISPSLHSGSPLDLAVKGPLVQELFNIAGFHVPAKLTKEQESLYLSIYSEMVGNTDTLCYDRKLYDGQLSKEDREKHAVMNGMSRNEYLNEILANLTSDDVRHLIKYEDELTQINKFQKIFPTHCTHKYHKFFDSPRYYNQLFDAWETRYHDNKLYRRQLLENLCRERVHQQVPFPGGKTKSWQILSPNELEEEAAKTVANNKRTKRKGKLGVLAKPQLRAPGGPRRLKARDPLPQSPKSYFNTPNGSPCFPKFSVFPNCKLESSIDCNSITNSSVVKVTEY